MDTELYDVEARAITDVMKLGCNCITGHNSGRYR